MQGRQSILSASSCRPFQGELKSLFKTLFTVAACLYLGGSHLAVLQMVAWTGMLVTYSAEDGLSAGLKDTFSGKKPCPMCKAIKSAQKAETDEAKGAPGPGATTLDKLAKEMLAGQIPRGITHFPGRDKEPEFLPVHPMVSRGDAPPVPPPRPLA